jgi:hypothetical protein
MITRAELLSGRADSSAPTRADAMQASVVAAAVKY